MTTLQADSNGVVKGSFLIPANHPAGTYEVGLEGVLGSLAKTSFTGQGTRQINNVQTIITTTLTTHVLRYDPLAQTFTFDRDMYLGAVDFWVVNKGVRDLSVDIRLCENGIPTPTILRSVRVPHGNVTNVANNVATRVTFDPVRLEAGVEYCFVLMSDDPNWAVEVATLGEKDKLTGRFITAQAYQIGTLLSSSNASTWTPHQKTDMRFRLHEAVFSTTKRDYALGTFDLYNADMIQAEFTASRVDEETDAVLVVTLPDGKTKYRLKEGSVATLPAKTSGKATVHMELTGTASKTPMALNGVSLVGVSVVQTGEYVTKAIPAGTDVDVKLTFEAMTGLASEVTAYYSTDGGWVEFPAPQQTQLQDGFRERRYSLTKITAPTLRVKLVLKGTAQDRPRVRNFRAVIL